MLIRDHHHPPVVQGDLIQLFGGILDPPGSLGDNNAPLVLGVNLTALEISYAHLAGRRVDRRVRVDTTTPAIRAFVPGRLEQWLEDPGYRKFEVSHSVLRLSCVFR